MKNYTLSKEIIAELEKIHRSLRDKRQADRVKAIIALSKGWSAAQVAEILLFDEKTSRHYFERYQKDGLEALLADNYSGAEPRLNEHQMKELDNYLQEYIFTEAKSVTAHIAKHYRVRYSLSGVTDLLHRLGFSYKKPAHVPGKQDPAQQQAFLEEYDQIKANKGEDDPVYFADATHSQHRCRCRWQPTYPPIYAGLPALGCYEAATPLRREGRCYRVSDPFREVSLCGPCPKLYLFLRKIAMAYSRRFVLKKGCRSITELKYAPH